MSDFTVEYDISYVVSGGFIFVDMNTILSLFEAMSSACSEHYFNVGSMEIECIDINYNYHEFSTFHDLTAFYSLNELTRSISIRFYSSVSECCCVSLNSEDFCIACCSQQLKACAINTVINNKLEKSISQLCKSYGAKLISDYNSKDIPVSVKFEHNNFEKEFRNSLNTYIKEIKNKGKWKERIIGFLFAVATQIVILLLSKFIDYFS